MILRNVRRYVGFAAPRAVVGHSAIVKFVIVSQTPPNVIMYKIMLQRGVQCYIRDVAARCEITVHALENALHVFWLPWRIRYTSSTTSASALVRL